jgi:hypothetical protein
MAKRQVKAHGSSGYRAGCRCVTCALAESGRKRNYRATGAGAKAVAAKVTPIRPEMTSPVIGDAEQAVIDWCASLPDASGRSVSVLCARRMAEILDEPAYRGMRVTAGRELSRIMNVLQAKPKHESGRLATVRQLTKARMSSRATSRLPSS